MSDFTRRDFIRSSAAMIAGGSLLPASAFAARVPLYEISLAQWSLNRSIRQGEIDNLDFAGLAKSRFGVSAVEYVNQFFMDKAKDAAYMAQMKRRADDAGVRSVLIMCDAEGNLGDPDAAARTKAVENHYKWAEAAKFLGCHSIRVNAGSRGSYEEQQELAADGLRRLTEFAAQGQINVIVENHGGLSSNGKWLAGVITKVNHPGCGTLPDFGNFRVSRDEMYDRYLGVQELMPFAKGVSAKSHAFDAAGNETETDFRRMMKIVLDAGYRGYVGIEYEGPGPEDEGILATRRLLEKVRDELGPTYA